MQLQFIRVTTGNVGLYPQRGAGLNKAASWSAPARLDQRARQLGLASCLSRRAQSAAARNQVDNSENRNVPISDFVDNAHLASAATRGAAPAAGKSHGMPDWCLARNFC